ncbi:MAG: NAD-glutamate dehydrogenase [Verrucomicrobia bacterium]|nr:NAD-glutamate dehydrogenase [Verrucomicrobiota bacterium]
MPRTTNPTIEPDVPTDPKPSSVLRIAQQASLDPNLLYEAVIELSNEGLLTAGCVNHAARILLTQLGLPAYFFRHISKDALKRVLRAIGTNMQQERGEFVLRGAVSEVQFDVDGGVQVRIATAQTRDRMETVLNPVMAGHRVEYYFGHAHQYYTYIIRPDPSPDTSAVLAGGSPFAFAWPTASEQMPPVTRERYESFLQRALASVVPLIEVSDVAATHETRIMFREDFGRSALPVIRKMMEELGLLLTRAYWETFRNPVGRIESVCSLYLESQSAAAGLPQALDQLHALLAIQPNEMDQLYVDGVLTLDEYLFALNGFAFVHSFVHKNLPAERDIMEGLGRPDLRDAMAKRVFDSNRAEYTRKVILNTMLGQPALLKQLHEIFSRRFDPRRRSTAGGRTVTKALHAFNRRVAIAFLDDKTAADIFTFMGRLISDTLKTNFYKVHKRSFAFRLAPTVLDPLAFPGKVHGVFFIVGFYAVGTHMRAEDIARGGVRLVRVTPGNYDNELDNMPMLNYALGPVAQRLKHKDIAESGAKAVIVPHPEYARDGLSATFDFTEGVMDLMQPSREIVDYLGEPEMIFFGPDEGTASFMDAVAQRARERGYKHWRTITTGKSIGIPHDVYGLTRDRRVFGLLPHGEKETELQLEGTTQLVTADTAKIHARLGNKIGASGMTTMGVMACLRTLLDHVGLKEEQVNLMMTGGPDGDLGANQIQSFKGRICLLVDGGSVLFDPEGLDKKALMELAFARHTQPRLNSLAYPAAKLGRHGFRVPRAAGRFTLPDGTRVEDGNFFHRNFLTDPRSRHCVAAANIQAFVPCGGLKDTVNAGNVRGFLALFRELRVIVEGANVFFDDTARDVIARESAILQIKDSSANKGGVTSSAIAEVLTAFLLGDNYERVLVENPKTRTRLIREVLDLVAANAVAETRMLLALYAKDQTPLHKLSARTSEELFALQAALQEKLDLLLAHKEIVNGALRAYIPAVLVEHLSMAKIRRTLNTPELKAYRDAILTKKLAAMALYRHAARWDEWQRELQADVIVACRELLRNA